MSGDSATPPGKFKKSQPDGSAHALAHRHCEAAITREHPLDAHLRAAAQRAASFAQLFGAEDWGRLSGFWHDLGKYSEAFQLYLRQPDGDSAHLEGLRGKVDHSSAGAIHAIRRLGEADPLSARILAYCLAGHHAGLPDWDTPSESSLARRLARMKTETADALRRASSDVLDQPAPALPSIVPADLPAEQPFQAALLTRMVFSCLVDADFLDTEQFMDAGRSADREAPLPTLAQLDDAVRAHLAAKQADATPTEVNARRGEVLQACLDAAGREPGFFSLTVPTGGGKTLSSLAFALAHARRHGLRRVIYAIPFTSIIEQNADVFRQALAGCADTTVVEHHSSIDPERETPFSRLACENWDAPVIVSTNVQFFESLFASRTSACRKLHNLVRSVIVLDEAQVLPVEFLAPCLAALKELVRNYGCTVVLCTATQPAIDRREEFSLGLDGVREIIPEPQRLYTNMKRVRVEQAGQLTDDELVVRLQAEPQVLCVVNTKRHAAELYRRLGVDGCAVHLSAAMCPAHRCKVIADMKSRLKAGRPCRLVSTQLIEAGVDIDFPVVYRAMCGLDSLAQAAGRCNREGKQELGRIIVFEAEQPPPPGHLSQTADTARELLGLYEDLLSTEAIEQYFRLHYWKKKDRWDSHKILECFRFSTEGLPLLDFRQAAEEFRLIPDATRPILVPWRKCGEQLIDQLRANPFPARSLRRALQRYTVSAHDNQFQQFRTAGWLEEIHEQFFALVCPDAYRSDIGLSLPDGSMIV